MTSSWRSIFEPITCKTANQIFIIIHINLQAMEDVIKYNVQDIPWKIIWFCLFGFVLVFVTISFCMSFLRSIHTYPSANPWWIWVTFAPWNHTKIKENTGLLSLPMKIVSSHDDVVKWKHFPRYWPFVRGIHRSPVNSPHKGQWRTALMFSLIRVWINGWVNSREAGDLRRYRAHLTSL